MMKIIFTAVIPLTIILGSCNNKNEQNSGNESDTAAVTGKSENSTGVTLKVESSVQYGKYLVDNNGRSLYLFKADSDKNSNCHDACAQAWPPLIAYNDPKAEEGIDTSLISTFQRKDGQMQVAYNGWPLYYYINDKDTGETTGQDIEQFGAEWYLVSPEGKEVPNEGHEDHK